MVEGVFVGVYFFFVGKMSSSFMRKMTQCHTTWRQVRHTSNNVEIVLCATKHITTI